VTRDLPRIPILPPRPMQRFTRLFQELDRTTKTSVRRAALARYFASAPPEDATWALRFLTGGRIRRAVSSGRLRAWAAERTGHPAWLVGECHGHVGDLAEALALLLDPPARPIDEPLHVTARRRIEPLPRLDDEGKREIVERTWDEFDPAAVLVWHKLVLGAFRVGVGARTVTHALAEVAGVPVAVMADRLAGRWEPDPERFEALLAPIRTGGGEGATARASVVQPYPFLLAHPLLEDPDERLGPPEAWLAEWKWDGLRAQVIRRAGRSLVWSRGEERLDRQFPEIVALADVLPDGTVLDGEILAWEDERPLPFQALQRRIGRIEDQPRLFMDVPVVLSAFDLLEIDGEDVRDRPLEERRVRLERLVREVADRSLRISPRLDADTWGEAAARRAAARDLGAEGLMLKRLDSTYGAGRPRGPWWKWKVDPHLVDAVLVLAQRGHGRRASLYTDYTFAVWKEDELVPVAKAYSGLTDEEIRAVARHVRRTTIGRHGPVRRVEPSLVFELAFDGVQRSGRHKAGLALRFPRMHRWRRDKTPEEADTLDVVRALLPAEAGGGEPGS